MLLFPRSDQLHRLSLVSDLVKNLDIWSSGRYVGEYVGEGSGEGPDDGLFQRQ